MSSPSSALPRTPKQRISVTSLRGTAEAGAMTIKIAKTAVLSIPRALLNTRARANPMPIAPPAGRVQTIVLIRLKSFLRRRQNRPGQRMYICIKDTQTRLQRRDGDDDSDL